MQNPENHNKVLSVLFEELKKRLTYIHTYGNIQMEISSFNAIAIQKRNLKSLEFYSLYVEGDKFTAIRSHILHTASLFGSTYICE